MPELESQGELTPIDMVERDFSMLFILSLFIIIFVFLGFMKIRWLEADIEEKSRDPAAVEEETVKVEFFKTPVGAMVEVQGTRFSVDVLTGEGLAALTAATDGKRVEVALDADMETKDWFPVAYGLTKRAKAVEFTTK